MIIPSRVQCDFCGESIGADPHTEITVPISHSLQIEIARGYDDVRQSRPKTLGLTLDFFGSLSFVPNAWKLHQCLGCTTAGVMNDVMDKVKELVRAEIDRRIASSRRAAAALEDLEPDPHERS